MSSQTNKYATLQEVRSKTFLGHPTGLWALFTTEMWERFCYYGMRALLVLYLISTITDSNPGFGWSESDANTLYGWFTGLVYLFPLLGGYIADRFIGQHRSVLIGGALMATGEFCLFYTEHFRQTAISTITMSSAPAAYLCFIFGLFLITLGNGFFKPCISVMVGQLYEEHDPRRDNAFNIFYMGINVGAFLAPFVAGSIGEKISWHWGFLTACIGMVFGLCTYSFLRPKYLGTIGMKLKSQEDEAAGKTNATEKVVANAATKKAPLTKVEIDRIAVILTLTFFCVAFWSIFEQAGTSLNIFAKKETNRQVPATLGKAFPGFLPNQDELDAKISTNELRANLHALNLALEKIALPTQGDVDVTEDAQASEEAMEQIAEQSDVAALVYAKDFQAAKDLVISQDPAAQVESENKEVDYAPETTAAIDAIDAVAEAYESATFSLNKANEARKLAGQDPLALPIDDFLALEQEGEEEIEQINATVEEMKQEQADVLSAATPEEQELILTGLRQDAAKKLQAQFLAKEKSSIDRDSAIWTFPTTWYQSVNPLAVVIFAPIFNLMWTFLRRFKLEPSTPVKFGIGLVVLSIAFGFMILGALQSSKTNGNAGPYWLLLTYLFCTFGELCLSPVGLSMVSRLAPKQYASLLMGVWFLSSAVAGYLSGYLAAVLGSGGAGSRVSFCFGSAAGLADYFLIMTLTPLIAGIIVFILSPKLRKMMHEDE
ncbi:MAG: oligopeptide:H+ symporter [Planctomycetia bacterium]|nr:oligopeptide:H+ symporter [Planctomycetia bacterium]